MSFFLTALQGACLLILLLRLLPGRRRPPPVTPEETPDLAGTVSIVVACLDEAARIAPCLEGLAAQGPVVREILFVDSGSTDRTQALVMAAATRDPRIRLLRDEPLPDGWVGKVWALQHGLQHATSDWVLGLDADTAPRAGMAGGALRAALNARFEAVSFAPRFSAAPAGVRWLQPALLVTLVYRFGATGASGTTDPERIMANGQCFLARRATLLGEGGYSSARSSFSDDVTLARHLARAGHRVGFLDGSRLYDVLSYRSMSEAWREWGRSLDLKDSTSRVRQWSDVLFLLMVQGLPVIVLFVVSGLWFVGRSSQALVPLAAVDAALLAVRVLLQFALARSYAQRGFAFWCSPLADPLAALRILLSTVRRPTRWRTREYGTLREAS